MCYTEEQIEKYLEILNNYNKDSTNQTEEEADAEAEAEASRKVRCWNCQTDGVVIEIYLLAKYQISHLVPAFLQNARPTI